MNDKDTRNDLQAAHQKEREVLFSNEAFSIGALQAVAGGSLFATLGQSQALLKLVGRPSFLVLLTCMTLALMAAVLAAYCKHQYKMWDVKAPLAGTAEEIKARSGRANGYLRAMRSAMLAALVLIGVGLLQFVLVSWAHVFLDPVPAGTTPV